MKITTESKPMVSVAMVAYNQSHLIKRAIKGVMRQKAPFDIELIIVDDCSVDATYEVALKMQRQYPGQIKLYRNHTNIGLQKNYLEAFSHCQGKYLALCDADDYWCDHSKLRCQIEYMESNPGCAITFHKVINHYAKAGTKSLSNPKQQIDSSINELSRCNFITNCSVVYRRELVDLSKLPLWITDNVWPDYPLHMLYASKGSIHFMARPMSVYRKGDGGAWTAAEEYERLKKALDVRMHLLSEFSSLPDATDGLKFAIQNILIAILKIANDDRKKEKAIEMLHTICQISDADILQLLNTGKTKSNFKKSILTNLRKFASFFIPLPRP